MGQDEEFMKELEEGTNFVVAKKHAKTPSKEARMVMRNHKGKLMRPGTSGKY